MANPATPPAVVPASSTSFQDKGIVLISYPKIVFLWPAWLVSLVATAVMWLAGAPGSNLSVVTGWVFLIVLSINLVVLAFDFPRSTWLLLFFVLVALVLAVALLATYHPALLPNLHAVVTKFKPDANATFYGLFAGVMTLIYITVLITARFDYWEVRPNELLHHHGVLSNLERFSAPNLRISKEINDIFEFMLAGSGRLILYPSNEPRAIVLDNVFFINQKEAAITKLLGALQVQVREKT